MVTVTADSVERVATRWRSSWSCFLHQLVQSFFIYPCMNVDVAGATYVLIPSAASFLHCVIALQNTRTPRGPPLSELPIGLFVAPSSSDLSVASCSLSCIGAVPEVVRCLCRVDDFSCLQASIPFAYDVCSHADPVAFGHTICCCQPSVT